MKTLSRDLHEKALRLAKTYLTAEAELVDILQRIDCARAYRELGYRSAFEYATRALGLGESTAYNFITVARKAAEVPLLKEKIALQEISVSKARTIAPVITPENQAEWLLAARTLSRRQLEREVARVRPEVLAPERTRYVHVDRIKLEMGLSEDLHQALRRAQDLVSSQMKKAVSLEETLAVLVGSYLEREDPLVRAEKAEERRARRAAHALGKPSVGDGQGGGQVLRGEACSVEESLIGREVPGGGGRSSGAEPSGGEASVVTGSSSGVESSAPRELLAPGRVNKKNAKKPQGRRFPLPAYIHRAVTLRDRNRCTYRGPDGKQCDQRRWLDFHHIKPVSVGGTDSVENLVTLCRGHHSMIHRREGLDS
ncbi:MAG: HNH endonuclease [Oligoflexia bacterium]|nr:HNH endonuclease [Oligoflexia bacterium]